MGKERLALWKRGWLFQIQQPRQDPPVTAAIEDEFGTHFHQVATGFFHQCHRLGIIETHRRHAMPVAHIHAPHGDGVSERLVEIAAWHLVGIIIPGAKLGGEIEIARFIATQDHRAIFPHELLLLHGVEQSRVFQQVHADGQHAFADDEAWEGLFLDDQHAEFFAVQQRRGNRARRAGPDDQDIRFQTFHISKNAARLNSNRWRRKIAVEFRKNTFVAFECDHTLAQSGNDIQLAHEQCDPYIHVTGHAQVRFGRRFEL